METGNESTEAIIRRRWILVAGFVACMEDTRLPKCVMFGELVGGMGCAGGKEKEWMACLLDNLRAYQRRSVDDCCSPGHGEVEWRKDGGIRGGTFHGHMDRCRESQGWTTAYSSINNMPERDGKDQGEDGPKQA